MDNRSSGFEKWMGDGRNIDYWLLPSGLRGNTKVLRKVQGASFSDIMMSCHSWPLVEKCQISWVKLIYCPTFGPLANSAVHSWFSGGFNILLMPGAALLQTDFRARLRGCFTELAQHLSTSVQSKSFPFCTTLAIARSEDDDMMDRRADGCLSDGVSDTLFMGHIVCGAVFIHAVSLFYQAYKATLHLCLK